MKHLLVAVLAIYVAGCAATPAGTDKTPAVESKTGVSAASAAATARQPDPEIDAAAFDLFKYHEGVWDARWEWFDPEGGLLGELTGIEEYKTVGDGYTQHMISTVQELKQVTHSLLVYDPLEKEVLFFASGDKGDYWIMRQDPVTWAMVSDPHIDADGKEMIIRFSILEKSENSMKIQMESSTDRGETWTVGFHQYSIRRTS